MTPIQAMALLAHYTNRQDCLKLPDAENRKALLDLQNRGYLEAGRVTAKAQVHLQDMLKTPEPVQQWISQAKNARDNFCRTSSEDIAPAPAISSLAAEAKAAEKASERAIAPEVSSLDVDLRSAPHGKPAQAQGKGVEYEDLSAPMPSMWNCEE